MSTTLHGIVLNIFAIGNIDECKMNLDNCDSNAVCTDANYDFTTFYGQPYTCLCKPGFNGDGYTCAGINACLIYF